MKHGLRRFPSGIAQRAPGELAARAAAFIAVLSVLAPLAACSNSTQAAAKASSTAKVVKKVPARAAAAASSAAGTVKGTIKQVGK